MKIVRKKRAARDGWPSEFSWDEELGVMIWVRLKGWRLAWPADAEAHGTTLAALRAELEGGEGCEPTK